MSEYTPPSAEECAAFLDHLDDHYRCADLARSPNATADILRRMLMTDFRGYTYLIRADIMDNPNVPEDVVETIMADAHTRQEQYAVYHYWARQLNAPIHESDDDTPYDLPIALCSAKKMDENTRNGLVFEAMPHFAEHMWHELASRDLIPLNYWDDAVDGSIFGPISWAGVSNEYMLRILGRGYFTEWATWEGYIEIGYGLENLADNAEDLFESGDWAYNVDASTPFPSDLLGTYLALGQRDGHLEIKDMDAVQVLLDDAYEGDETAFEFDVTITGEPAWAGPKWHQMTFAAKQNLTQNLIDSLSHPYLGGWGFSEHLLALIAIHPDTPDEVVTTIKGLGLKAVDAALAEAAAE